MSDEINFEPDSTSRAAKNPRHRRQTQDDSVDWQPYTRIAPGVYRAYCFWAKRYRDPGLHRWTCLLRFNVFGNELTRAIAESVPLWFALGDGEKPRATRRGKYLPEWVRANGDPPTKGDRLSPRVFVHRFARVEVGDAKSSVPYSVVKRIIDWETGISGHSISKSTNQGRPDKSYSPSGGYDW
jgi:hypothetical protein